MIRDEIWPEDFIVQGSDVNTLRAALLRHVLPLTPPKNMPESDYDTMVTWLRDMAKKACEENAPWSNDCPVLLRDSLEEKIINVLELDNLDMHVRYSGWPRNRDIAVFKGVVPVKKGLKYIVMEGFFHWRKKKRKEEFDDVEMAIQHIYA